MMDRCGFEVALISLKAGQRVTRAGWNGKGMWLAMVPGHEWLVQNDGAPTRGIARIAGLNYRTLPWIGMKTADDAYVPWLASQSDLLADDWRLVTDEPGNGV